MDTLTSAPVAPLLNRLFAEAEASESSHPSSGNWLGLGPDEQTRLLHSRTEYAMLYGRLKDLPLAVSRSTGDLLYLLARTCDARCIVEFGTSFGLSTICLAAALMDNGGGRLITTEMEPSKLARASAHLAEAGLEALVEFRAGDALKTLARDLPPVVDLLFLDGAKALYPDVLAMVAPRLRSGALIVADNADLCLDYLVRVRAPGSGFLSVVVGDDVELSICLGSPRPDSGSTP